MVMPLRRLTKIMNLMVGIRKALAQLILILEKLKGIMRDVNKCTD